LTINSEHASQLNQADITDNLFGKFFCDRASFFIIKNPQNEVFESKATSIVLYYLDNELCQSKYILESDITTQLINELGNFKITGLDFRNRELLEVEKIVRKNSTGWTLNSKLDNYELRWIKGNKEIRYRVTIHTGGDRYVYRERAMNYDAEFTQIEKYCS
jgi:hypothetical protein